MEETYHVTFSDDDEAISKSSTEGDEINFNENRSFPDDEFLVPRNKVSQCSSNDDYFSYVPAFDPLSTYNITIPDHVTSSNIPRDLNSPDEHPGFTTADDHPVPNKHDEFESVEDLGLGEDQVSIIHEPISEPKPTPINISPSPEVFIDPPVPQDRWSREKYIELVNILSEPQAWVTTRSIIRDFEAASAHECLYVNFLSEIEPKKLIEALEEEGWIIAMQKELNQFKRTRIKAVNIFLAYAAYMGFMVYQMDVKSAFLNGKISKDVYVQQLPGFESSEFPNYVCKLDKALYGLKQALRAWKSTSRGCQILGEKLVCWSEKKQSSMVMSSAEAEYIAAAGCYAQVLWIKSQLADYDVLYDKGVHHRIQTPDRVVKPNRSI
ncbi:retrovirus-related pol polyprotein from transposon TNT 1-94 [Tanacetum coccineum]